MKKIIFVFILTSQFAFSATRTIANGGGNFSATGTWVEGAVPVAGDAVVATGTSGNLTVDVASGGVGLLSFDMTNYTGVLTFNATLTVSGAVKFVAGMGTIAGTSDLICNTTATLTSGGKTLTGGLQLKGTSQTYTMSGAWIVNGTLTLSGTTAITVNSSTLSCGGLTVTTSTSGTCVITLTGGTWSGAGTLSNSLTLNGSSTVSGTVNYSSGTLTYSSGTITVTGSTLTFPSSAVTLNTNGMSWNNITISSSITVTINSLLTATGTLTINNGVSFPTFAGTSGFTVGTFTLAFITGQTVTFANGKTYTITTAFNCFLSRLGQISTLTSDHASVKAIITLNQGATCNVLANFTRVDASAGRTIWTFNGTVTTCFNINSFTDMKTIYSTGVN